MNALFSGQDCFLAKEPWQAVIVHDRNIPTRTSAGEIMNPGNLEVGDRYFQLLAMVPGILRQGYALREANNRGEPIDIAQAVLLAETAQRVHAGFLEWHPRLLTIAPTPREILSEDSASIFPLVLKHDSVWMGALHMGYWASMLILQETLVQCRFPVDYADCNKEFALNILRSVETVGQGLMGGYRCGYSIRIAFEFVDDKQKAWLGMWLGRFEKNYAATSTKTYPSMET